MDALLRDLWALANQAMLRVSAALADTPQETIRLTGIFGLAALLVGLYQLRNGGPGGGNGADIRPADQQQGAVSTSGTIKKETSSPANLSPLGVAVNSRLRDMRRVTLSCPGVILRERTAAELEEGAELMPEIVKVVQEMASQSEIYLLANVDSDVGEATARGALEASGILGAGADSIPPHKLLFCGTVPGKVSMVRQLEPDLHIDAAQSTVEDLQRFIPRLVYIPPAPSSTGISGANTEIATSLLAYFGLPAGGTEAQ